MPIDASIPLGAKAPDPTQNLSGLLNIANSAQQFQQNQQKTQQGGIDLQERQGVQGVLADPSNYTGADGTVDFSKALPAIMRVAPTTGMKYVQGLADAQKAHTDATQAINNLSSDNRLHLSNTLASIPPGADPDVVGKTVDAVRKLYKGIDPAADQFMAGYKASLQKGQQAADSFVQQQARQVLPQATQQTMATPDGPQVDNGQQIIGVNTKPGVPGYPQGSQVFSVQKQLPPTTPTVAPGTNQPGYVGPQPGGAAQAPQPQAQPGVRGSFTGNPSDVQMAIGQIRDPQQRANAQAAFEAQMRATNGQLPAPGFVPSGPVPGANESKGGSVQVINDHWTKINAGAADAPVASALLSTIKQLAPGAITGTEAGKRAYWNGLFNALGVGDKATGDIQKDTDLLNKSMAQLNLNTPATTDAMRTLIEAGRPHSTMSAAAIKEAAGQIEGQLKANMAMRNMLAPDKRYADATGDLSHYQQKMQSLQDVADPRIFQYASMPKGKERTDFLNRQPDAMDLRRKAEVLTKMGALQ